MTRLEFLTIVLTFAYISVASSSPISLAQYSSSSENEESKIYNGTLAPSSYPFLATFIRRQKTNPTNFHEFCGGSLIDSTHILTAAHCVHNMEDTMNVWAIDVWLAASSIHPPVYEQKFTIESMKSVHFHKDYVQTPTVDNDIAVVTLPSAASITDKVSTICLGKLDNYDDLDVTVAGFGFFNCKKASEVLRYASGKSLDYTSCAKHFPKSQNICKSKICNFLKNPDGGYASTDEGDSGSAMFTKRQDEYVQIGVVSNSVPLPDNCPNPKYPAILALPAEYENLISEWGASPKYCN